MICHECQCIFIHINRTGGQSIESAFGQPIQDHRLPVEYKQLGDYWNSYFKFSFVRNPWDRMVSVFFNRHRQKAGNFEKWLLDLDVVSERVVQSDWLEDMDFIGRFENLHEDFSHVCKLLGVDKKLPHVGASRHRHYSHYYNDKTREWVAENCRKDIEEFGYSYAKTFL